MRWSAESLASTRRITALHPVPPLLGRRRKTRLSTSAAPAVRTRTAGQLFFFFFTPPRELGASAVHSFEVGPSLTADRCTVRCPALAVVQGGVQSHGAVRRRSAATSRCALFCVGECGRRTGAEQCGKGGLAALAVFSRFVPKATGTEQGKTLLGGALTQPE